MSSLMMAALMKKMSSSSSSSSDYDYDYGYGDYSYDQGMGGSYEYDYDYTYSDEDAAPSPLSSLLQQMLQAKLTKTEPLQLTQMDLAEPAVTFPAPEAEKPQTAAGSDENVEIAPQTAPTKTPGRIEEISYRSAP